MKHHVQDATRHIAYLGTNRKLMPGYSTIDVYRAPLVISTAVHSLCKQVRWQGLRGVVGDLK